MNGSKPKSNILWYKKEFLLKNMQSVFWYIWLISGLMEIALPIVTQDKTMQANFQSVLTCLFLLPLLQSSSISVWKEISPDGGLEQEPKDMI